MIRHALVTGAGGFIGRTLCTVLTAQGVTVTALLRRARAHGPWGRAVVVDLACAAPAEELFADVDCVFHLAGHAHAAVSPGDEARHRAVSVEGTRRLLAACAHAAPRVVYASSVKAMGESTPPGGLDESAPARPSTAYGRARLEAEGLVLGARACRHASVLRLPLVYGPGVRGNLRRMLRAVRAGRMPLLPDLGNRRSMVHVEDVAAAALAAATRPAAAGRVYLLSDGVDYAPRAVQQMMYEAAGRRPPGSIPAPLLRWLARGGDALARLGLRAPGFDSGALAKLAQNAIYRPARARAELGFEARHDLRSALPAMLAALDEEAGS